MNLPASSLQELYKINVRLCYPFVEAVLSTLSTQCGVAGRMGKPFFKSIDLNNQTDIAISTSIASNESQSTVVFVFSEPIFLTLMGKMYGQNYSQLSPELEDGAKEFINIVFNRAKKPLAEKGMAAVRAIPQITFGHSMKISYLTRGQTIALPLETDVGTITVEITTQDVTVSDSI